MNCPRCNGLMVIDQLADPYEDVASDGRRCVNCGDIEDEVILKNRLQPPPVVKRYFTRLPGGSGRFVLAERVTEALSLDLGECRYLGEGGSRLAALQLSSHCQGTKPGEKE
jgi:hypothetical protein